MPERREPVTIWQIIGVMIAVPVVLFFVLLNLWSCAAPYILVAQHLN